MKSLSQFISEAKQTVDTSKINEVKNVVNDIYLNRTQTNKAEFEDCYNILKDIVSNLKESEWRSQSSTKKNWIMLSEDNQKRWSGDWFIIGEPNENEKKYPYIYKLELDKNKVRAQVCKKFITELSQQYGNGKGQNEIIPCKIYYF